MRSLNPGMDQVELNDGSSSVCCKVGTSFDMHREAEVELSIKIAEPEACDQMYESLARLHSNYYKHKDN
ncbi:hypothetical protein P7K49_007802 [Saguinus oedipus]|uniref:Uncharacterized protein n=1 Tax=Saguinus oedipus TaxID=9490 RepID=A0ABQ9VVX9_SAGOE|nr:hypothetical protein P7K49_007802 [Saguinus oedipus]